MKQKEITKLSEKKEVIMNHFWDKGALFVRELRELYPEPKPHFNTLSTQVRELETEGFLDHKAYGPTYQYFPIVTRSEYSKFSIGGFIGNYFGNSYLNAVSAFVGDGKVSIGELKELIEHLEKKEKMMTFLTYQLKVAVIMAVFYIFFRLLLIKDSWHRLNRIVLLSTALLSFLLPVCIITIHKTEVLPMPVAQLMQAVSSTPALPSVPWWQIALMAVYTAGVVFVLARVLTSVIRVRSIIKNARKEFTPDGTQVYIMPGNAASFSWMGHIVISEADWNNNESAIIRHEKAHVALHHSIDVLITDLIAAAQWFNPAIWMLRIDLRAVHEYEADDTVLRAGTDLRSYQYLLISKAAAMNGYTIANNFNHSILKNRIFMMEKERTTKKSLLRALYLLPLVCISLALNAKTKVNYVYDDAQSDQAPRKIIGRVTYESDTLKYKNLNPEKEIKWDANAYDSPEGKSVDELIKSLPGVEYDENGNVTVNGKVVSRILVNGEEVPMNKTDSISSTVVK